MHRYAIALGSNRCHGRHGAPARIVTAACRALGDAGAQVTAISPIYRTLPMGPGGRAYANAAALIVTALPPTALLALLKAIEQAFGRRRGRRWGARVIDLDIVLWSGGTWRSGGRAPLTVPHAGLAERRFVLDPLARIAGDWRTPAGPSVRQLRGRHLAIGRRAMLTRPAPRHRGRIAPGS